MNETSRLTGDRQKEEAADMATLRVPLARSMTKLDRSLFTKTVTLPAATVSDNRNIGRYRRLLEKSRDLINLDRLDPVRPHPDQAQAATGRKCLLLRPHIDVKEPSTWGPVIDEAVKSDDLSMIPYQVTLGYDYWTYHDIIENIIPEELHDELPTGYNSVGHVAHLNLRDRYLPYKEIIAEILMDKARNIRTVINKIDDVGAESQYRTFNYEILSGPDDLDVEARENNCVFRFNYAKVYWNSKLETEHTRIIKLFQPGEVVCDVMAGIGPFAVPAGRKEVFVWANDMNPESYLCLEDSVKRNKVAQFVKPFNEDGRTFIQKAVNLVHEASLRGDCAVIPVKVSRAEKANKPTPVPRKVPVPATISHFVMNLPASATTFLHHFKGVYAGKEHLFEPKTSAKLPMVHVHCFAVKNREDNNASAFEDIVQRIQDEIGVRLAVGDGKKEGEVSIHDVRDVAPKKRMFCASFRLPASVAFSKQ